MNLIGVNASRKLFVLVLALAGCAAGAASQDIAFQVDPAQTTVKFTLGDVLHTVHGTFKLKHGALQIDPTARKVAGEIVVDAGSGESGSGMRDRKMNKEVLESASYPEISFRPDRFEGTVPSQGKSSVMIHGTFSIHGVESRNYRFRPRWIYRLTTGPQSYTSPFLTRSGG